LKMGTILSPSNICTPAGAQLEVVDVAGNTVNLKADGKYCAADASGISCTLSEPTEKCNFDIICKIGCSATGVVQTAAKMDVLQNKVHKELQKPGVDPQVVAAEKKAKEVQEGDETNDAMCTQSTASQSFPGLVGGLQCCGQTTDCKTSRRRRRKKEQQRRCRDDLSDASFYISAGNGGKCMPFNKRSALAGMSYTHRTTEGGKTVTITTKGKISTPTKAGKNVGVLGLKRVKCASSTIPGKIASCITFKIAVCLDCSSVAGTLSRRRRDKEPHRRRRGLLVSSETERKFTIKDAEIMYDKCVTKAFGDGFVKPAFILENNSSNSGVNDDALTRCEAWIQIF